MVTCFPFRELQIDSHDASGDLPARLAASVFIAPRPFAPLRASVSELLVAVKGRSFIGWINGDRFRMILMSPVSPGRMVRQYGQVLIVGRVEGSTLRFHLRPPLFTLVFLPLWSAALLSVIALTWLGPVHSAFVESILAGALLLPYTVIIPLYLSEARLALARLEACFGEARASQP